MAIRTNTLDPTVVTSLRNDRKRKCPGATIAPSTSGNITDRVATHLPPRKIVRVVPTQRTISQSESNNPQHRLLSVLPETKTWVGYQEIPNAFASTQKDTQTWSFPVLSAVRRGKVDLLRNFLHKGYNLTSSNKFGETLLHVACRKALVSVVKFLIEEAGMPVNIHDDTGRTPLHDAFWTPEPHEELIHLLVAKSPDMLLVQDQRGHSPLQYARRSHWPTWDNYLQTRSTELQMAFQNADQRRLE